MRPCPRNCDRHRFDAQEDEARLAVVVLSAKGLEAQLLDPSAPGRQEFTVDLLEGEHSRMEQLVDRWAPSAVEV